LKALQTFGQSWDESNNEGKHETHKDHSNALALASSFSCFRAAASAFSRSTSASLWGSKSFRHHSRPRARRNMGEDANTLLFSDQTRGLEGLRGL
jgi:hypothetical protein